MNTLNELVTLRKDLIHEIEQALQNGGGPEFFAATERLRAGDALLEQAASTWRKFKGPEVPSGTKAIAPFPNHVSSQTKAEEIRSGWVGKNFGRALTRIRGNLYRNTRGEVVGIAYGKENADRPNRWFLGLPECRFSPDIKFQHTILLCDSLSGKLDGICLPKEIVNQNRGKLSKSGGQFKFNVIKNTEGWWWSVPMIPNIDVTSHINAFSLVL